QAEDQLGIKSTNDLFEKIEKLYKDKHSIADTPLLQIHFCIMPSVALQRSGLILSSNGLEYITLTESILEATQNFTTTKNIEAVYNYLGMNHEISSEIMEKYYLPARQQGKRVTVKNGIQNPQ
ncbi:21843_t:CDS:2, partial [Racocetra persica]